MNSGFTDNIGYKPGLADTYTADQVPGNRLRLKKDMTVYVGHVGSPQTEQWKSGFLTPPVYSWIVRNGSLYWMIGEIQPIRYVKHQSDGFELVADYGGGDHLDLDDDWSNPLDFILEDFTDKITAILTVGAVGMGVYLVAPYVPVILDQFLDD
jgi:hypothetical protein